MRIAIPKDRKANEHTSIRVYSFRAPGDGRDIDELASEYPLSQTRDLILAIEAARDWVFRSQEMFGTPPPQCLNERIEWLARVEIFLQNLEDSIHKYRDLEVCKLRSGDPWYDATAELRDACPTDWDKRGAMRQAIGCMSLFWISNVCNRLRFIMALMSRDDESQL